MGPRPSLSCSISLNTSLTPEQQQIYQDNRTIDNLLRLAKTVAVVGLSSDRQKASFFVANYLQQKGYRIIPVNPRGGTILGETVYPDIASVPDKIDIIDIFRPPGEIEPIVDQAIARLDGPAIWMQLRLVNMLAAEKARVARLTVILDKCLKMEHGRSSGGLHFAGMNTEFISARKRVA